MGALRHSNGDALSRNWSMRLFPASSRTE
jgi:hypothetical protein